jgi:DNA modification methylase
LVHPFCEQDSITLYQGDCIDVLPQLPAGSVQLCVTSPPYWGLRDYGIPGRVWDGAEGCEHEWGNEEPGDPRGGSGPNGKNGYGEGYARANPRGSLCRLCSAWLGTLGLEPTPEMYVRHLVQVFAEVRRVLRDDGVLVLNLGDSMSGSGKGGNGGPTSQLQKPLERQGFVDRRSDIAGLAPKNLLLMPFRVALALQADGWYIRSVMPWVKANCLPESVRDRPTNAVEYLFLCSKSQRYVWDATAIRRSNSSLDQLAHNQRYARPYEAYDSRAGETGQPGNTNNVGIHARPGPAGRNFRNSDPFMDSLKGLLCDDWGDPMALLVNPLPLKAAHFAAYPPKLVEPFIKAAAPERTCSVCGKAWERITERTPMKVAHSAKHNGYGVRTAEGLTGTMTQAPSSTTLGFRPACACDVPTVPATVLDPFSGAATTLLVAQRLGRRAVGIELSADYCAIAKERLNVGLPLDELVNDEPEQLTMEVTA